MARVNNYSFFVYFNSCCSHLQYRAAIKRFVSIQFLILKQLVKLFGRGINPSQGRYLKQIQNKHGLTGIRTHDPQCSVFKLPKTFHTLDHAATVVGSSSIGRQIIMLFKIAVMKVAVGFFSPETRILLLHGMKWNKSVVYTCVKVLYS
jgi:hypothetical protein